MVLGATLVAQEPPSWVAYQRGRLAFSQGRWAEAVQHFRLALERRSVFPEADWYLGRVYLAQGELSSAQRHFEAALADADFLRFAEDRYAILYDYDDLLALGSGPERLQRRVALLREQILLSRPTEQRPVAGGLVSQAEAERQRFLNAFLEAYTGRAEERREALDRALFLFRPPADYTREALIRLAQIGVAGGEVLGPRQAAAYSLHAVLMGFTQAIAELQDQDPDFQFSVLTPQPYPPLPNIPARVYSRFSFQNLLQPSGGSGAPPRRLRRYETLYRHLVEGGTPRALKVLAQALQLWAEQAARVIQAGEGWQGRFLRVLGSAEPLQEPWRSLSALGEREDLTPAAALRIVQHLGVRQAWVCRVLVDLFPETPEGVWGRSRLRELEGEGGLVRPTLAR